MLWIVLMVLLVCAVLGAPPIGYAPTTWGWYPSTGLGLVIIVLLVLFFAHRL